MTSPSPEPSPTNWQEALTAAMQAAAGGGSQTGTSGSSTVSTGDPWVPPWEPYGNVQWGGEYHQTYAPGSQNQVPGGIAYSPNYEDASQVSGDLMTIKAKNPALYNAIRGALIRDNWVAGTSDDPSVDAIGAAWNRVVTAALKDKDNPLALLGITGVADPTAPGGPGSGAGSSGGSGGSAGAYTGPVTSVNEQTTLLSRQDAEAAIDGSLREFLGREASPEEITRFKALFNKRARGNPQTSTTVSTPTINDAGQQTGSTSQTTTRGGPNQSVLAERFAKQHEGYSEYQAATTFMDAFRSAVAGG